MTAAVKTVLFVDYDSLYLSLRMRDPGSARRFASRPSAWIEAIESGQILAPVADPPVRRRILMRRIYADPKLLGKARPAFAAQGFQIVDCPPLPGRERNSAEIQMVLDTVDAINHQTGFEEFILLSADSDLTPLIFRLRSYNRATTIYASAMTTAGYRAVADGALEEAALVALLGETADAESPELDEPDEDAPAGRTTSEREDLASLARRVHQMTSVPLFPPRVYVELFRALAHEIAENGYHFQATAENVAARLVASGRNASRRQVAFVVKGLALKGHVFSVNDTPERLAEVFKEQVIYLARNAGMEIDETVEMQVKAWIAARPGGQEPPALAPPKPAAAAIPAASPPSAAPVSAAKMAPIPSPPPIQDAPEAPARTRPIILRSTEPPLPQPIRPITVRPATADPAPRTAAEPRKPAVPIQPAAANTDVPAKPVRPAATAKPEAPPAPPAPETATETIRPRATIGPPRARVMRSVPASEAPPAAPAAVPATRSTGTSTTVRPPARRSAPVESPKEDDKDPIESSILAAIAEAVDVLVVEDGTANPPDAKEAPALQKQPPPQPAADDGDIGDEIQRILAAYSQNRKPSGK